MPEVFFISLQENLSLVYKKVYSIEAIKILIILLCTQKSEYFMFSLNFQNVLSNFIIHMKCLVLYIVKETFHMEEY